MLNQKYNSLFNKRHFFLYFIFGITSMLVGFVFLLIFYLYFNFNFFISYFFSAHVGVFLSFTLNRHFTFRTPDSLIRRFVFFYLIAFFGVIIGYLSAIIAKEIFSFNFAIASLCSYFIAYIFQYISNKIITFKK